MSDALEARLRDDNWHGLTAREQDAIRLEAADRLRGDAEDARRYRWLRDEATAGLWEHLNDVRLIAGSQMDSEIDAAQGEGK